MAYYRTFLVDQGGVVAGSVSKTPATRQPDRDSIWKVICDGGRVTVIGHVGKLTCQVAHARWRHGQLDRRVTLKGAPELSAEVWTLIRDSLASEVGPSVEEEIERKPGARRRRAAPVAAPYDPLALHPPSPRLKKIIWASFALVFAGLTPILYTCGTKDEPAPRPAPPPPVATKAPAPVIENKSIESIEARIAKAETFADALVLAKPSMAAGPTVFAAYASTRLRWEDVDVAAETSFAHAIKDVDAERGKRMCVDGVIRDIARRDIGPRKAFEGQLRLAPADTIQFVAVGTTGELVRDRDARLCGVVTGQVENRIQMVGMFDLPENRDPIVEQ